MTITTVVATETTAVAIAITTAVATATTAVAMFLFHPIWDGMKWDRLGLVRSGLS